MHNIVNSSGSEVDKYSQKTAAVEQTDLSSSHLATGWCFCGGTAHLRDEAAEVWRD